MKEVILAKYGEIALKGLNKHTFEQLLVNNIKRRIRSLGQFNITRAQSTIYIEPLNEECDVDTAVERLKKIFGIAILCRSIEVPKDFQKITEMTMEYLEDIMPFHKTFKVEAKRSDKHFPMKSPQICTELGGDILEHFPHLSVDVKNPEITVTVEIRETNAYVHAKKIEGAGGMPVGSSGEALLLLSGGIDSPVAGYMMAKRGLHISAIHYVSPPYTSERAKMKVEKLCEIISEYCGNIRFYCVPFTEIQEKIRDKCPEELFTIIMRRLMMEIAQRIAEKNGLEALITGESVGQVASQTMSAIACTDAAARIPVFRPVIGMDKSEIVTISRKIDTFETSIEPYEDCCTVFTPKHPKTKPQLDEVLKAQAMFDFEPLIEEAVKNTTVEVFKPQA